MPLSSQHLVALAIINQLSSFCGFSPDPQASVLTSRNLRPEANESSTRSDGCQSYSRMKGLAGRQPRLSGPSAIPPAAADRPHLLKERKDGAGDSRESTGVVCRSCSGFSKDAGCGFSLSFNLITAMDCESSSARKSWKSLETEEICYGALRAICIEAQVNLL